MITLSHLGYKAKPLIDLHYVHFLRRKERWKGCDWCHGHVAAVASGSGRVEDLHLQLLTP